MYILSFIFVQKKHTTMKNLLYLLFTVCLFTACSGSEDEPPKDYTSFVVYNNTPIKFEKAVMGYEKDGLWVKIADIGELEIDSYSEEFILDDFIQYDMYLFSFYLGETRRSEVPFSLKKNEQNILKFPKEFRGKSVNKEDPTQYPQ